MLSHILQKRLLYKIACTEKIKKLIDGFRSIKALISKSFMDSSSNVIDVFRISQITNVCTTSLKANTSHLSLYIRG